MHRFATTRIAAAVIATTVVCGSAAGCAGGGAAATPTAPAGGASGTPPAALGTMPSAAVSVDPSATATTGVLPFPTRRAAPLLRARYATSPPFDLAFTFEAPGEGWETLHLLGEFLDVARFDGPSRSVPPVRWIAFGHPERIHGTREVPAAGLTPLGIAGELRERADLDAGEPVPFSVAGLDGVRLDLRTDRPDTPIFGGPAGTLSLQPSRDARMGIVVADGEPLLVLVFAARDELDRAWDEAQPVLDSISFDVPAGP